MMKRNSYAKKSLGQNFLEDENYIRRILDLVAPAAGDHVLEIGPGRGAITSSLLDSGARVTAVEIDRELVPVLRETYKSYENFEVIEADALEIDFSKLAGGEKLRVVANLPYYISTAILQRLIEFRDQFVDMTLMFQLEVVDRITAPPGSSDRGFLTVLTEAYLDAEKKFEIPPTSFRPAPKVDSAVVVLSPRAGSGPPLDSFRAFVSAAFAQKRKTIVNNLKLIRPDGREVIGSAGLDPSRRAETLTLEEWLRLFAAFATAA
jgi:16S rRNA (adenine1518-N6/adenine1519-N6)-dimethyltransferase